eukprot:1158130-Pelagomonas_calceolata.AAC.1
MGAAREVNKTYLQVQDRVHFLINNLTEDTVALRASEIKAKVGGNQPPPGLLFHPECSKSGL